ncbi:MAG: cupin domain-containing protein [Spirochaetes bacterium]|nr:cupin domain-containing protein [Spirochaetota bacterium]
MVYRKKDAVRIEKHGVSMTIYNNAEQCPQAAVAYQETARGHAEEFLHQRSAFIYYIIEGSGTWYIEDVPHEVAASDVIIVPPGRRFYFTGNLKQLCITAPAWSQEGEHHVRFVDMG